MGAESHAHVLVIEDDRVVAEAMVFHLERAGLRVDAAPDGLSGVRALRNRPPDILVLDLMLPHLDGWFIIREARSAFPHLPIIVVTARTNEHDRVEVLSLGADDVMSKPFSMRELVARVQGALRRTDALSAERDRGGPVAAGDLTIDPERMSVTRGGRPLALTPLEFRLLLVLAQNDGRVLSRDEIYRLVWGGERLHGDRSVDVLVRRLRSKVDEGAGRYTHIQTLHGVGYRLEPIGRDPVPADAALPTATLDA
ncbi:MAG: response regulator transcription factor [Actinomycetota bacterium]